MAEKSPRLQHKWVSHKHLLLRTDRLNIWSLYYVVLTANSKLG